MSGIPLSRYQKEHGFTARRYDTCQIGVTVERPLLYQRIEERVDRMMAAGLLDEVRGLLADGYGRELKSMRSIGYKEAVAYLCGDVDLGETIRLIKRNTRWYAKRQLTWFKADSDILWFENSEKFDTLLKHTINFYELQEDNNHGEGTV